MKEKEWQALDLLAQGLTHREVARQVGVDPKTLSRWKNRADFANARKMTGDALIERGRQRIAEQYDQLLDRMFAIATSDHYKASDQIKAFEALSRICGADRIPEKPLPNPNLPDHPYSPQEALDNWRLMQSNLQAMVASALAEGAASGNLTQMAENVEALYRIAAVAKDFARLQVPERLFDEDGDRHNSDDVIELLLEGTNDAGHP